MPVVCEQESYRVGPFKVTELSPNRLRITAKYVPDPAIMVVRHARRREWQRFIRDEDDTDNVLLANNKYERSRSAPAWAHAPTPTPLQAAIADLLPRGVRANWQRAQSSQRAPTNRTLSGTSASAPDTRDPRAAHACQ
jgi:hypothetical protein